MTWAAVIALVVAGLAMIAAFYLGERSERLRQMKTQSSNMAKVEEARARGEEAESTARKVFEEAKQRRLARLKLIKQEDPSIEEANALIDEANKF